MPEPDDDATRWWWWVAFVVAAMLASVALRLAWYKPLLALALLIGALVIGGVWWLLRWRLRRSFEAGDVQGVLSRWTRSLRRMPDVQTLEPLMTATAFAAYGWVTEARAALAQAERGKAWDEALDQRLFVDALLLTFEGYPDDAVERARRLVRLPLAIDDAAQRTQVELLRRATAAFTRAFAHRTEPGDRELLEWATEMSPLVFWAMRYAGAVVAIDEGNTTRAGALLEGAPDWPARSAFQAFHAEIAAVVARGGL